MLFRWARSRATCVRQLLWRLQAPRRSWARRLKSWAEGRFEKVDTMRNQNVRAFGLDRGLPLEA